ncbi:MAG: polymerase sigma factor [Thermoanaerobacteraceae bacterium]|jgi:RNA polymerase sigma factor|nr:polymerase sigma factor [Thermoanaerobacteraceae bacterium]
MAQMIAADSKLREHLLTNKTLPINAMLEKVKISRKTIERHRKYIIAVTLILVEDFPYLLEYIKGV